MITLPIKIFDLKAIEPIVFISHQTASKLKLRHTFIVVIKNEINDRTFCATPVVTEKMIEDDVIGISIDDAKWLNVIENAPVSVFIRRSLQSIDYLKQKMTGLITSWDQKQVYSITQDISKRMFTNLETASFVLNSYYKGYTEDETAAFAKNMAQHGSIFDFQEKTYDKHSIGGIPGNKVSLVIVPIVASVGLLIPKTSSRAITSPSGTADSMEVLANIDFSAEEVTEIAPKSRGMIVHNATLKLSPMDDIVVKVKRLLDVEPEEQMLASIISTKIAMGVSSLVIDIPTGHGAKILNQNQGINFAHKLIKLCTDVGINVEAMLTYGDRPLGYGIGPALEAREALQVLEGQENEPVLNKSLELAGTLLEIGGVAPPSKGFSFARELVHSGKALNKFLEIIEYQGGSPNIKSTEISVGEYKETIYAQKDGYVIAIKNEETKRICRTAGAPGTKSAGILLRVRVGQYVKEGDPLFIIYSDSEAKLSNAIQMAISMPPVSIEGMILRRVKSNQTKV
jgi:AMP phosphorylase